jgi:hypothetical protein
MITKLFCLPSFRFPNLLIRFDPAAVDSMSARVRSDLIAAMTLLTQFRLVSRDELTRNLSSYSIVSHKLNVTSVRQTDVHFWVASACLLCPMLGFQLLQGHVFILKPKTDNCLESMIQYTAAPRVELLEWGFEVM